MNPFIILAISLFLICSLVTWEEFKGFIEYCKEYHFQILGCLEWKEIEK